MKRYKHIYVVLLLLFWISGAAQPIEYFASPSGDGVGTMGDPLDLQTALEDSTSPLNPGDTLWLLDEGTVFTGRFTTDLQGTALLPITVASYPGEWAILNGAIPNPPPTGVTFSVQSDHVIFKDFEVTNLGLITRDEDHPSFYKCGGIENGNEIGGGSLSTGQFINIWVHDNPGTGVASWKRTTDTSFRDCIVYNNGWVEPNGTRYNHGPGFYVQNESELDRLFYNNTVFDNFSFGFQIWSAEDDANSEYVKNVIVRSGSVFNNSYELGQSQAGILVSGADENGINIPRDIEIDRNEVYHNLLTATSGAGSAIRLGEGNPLTPVLQDIEITENLLVSRNQSLIIGKVETLTYTNNFLVTGFITINNNSQLEPFPLWDFDNNKYFTKQSIDFIRRNGDPLEKIQYAEWIIPPWSKEQAGNSTYEGNPSGLIGEQRDHIVQNIGNPNTFKVTIYDTRTGQTNHDVPFPAGFEDLNYQITDMEYLPDAENTNPSSIPGVSSASGVVNFPLNLTDHNPPRGWPAPGQSQIPKTLSNFNVFLIEFVSGVCIPDFNLQNITETSTITYKATNTITAAGTGTFYVIEPSAVVVHEAGERITLKSGFHAKSGSNYHAVIQECIPGVQIPFTGIDIIATVSPPPLKGSLKDHENLDTKELVFVSPNPFKDVINFTLSEDVVLNEYSLQLHDMYGFEVRNVGSNSELIKSENQIRYTNSSLKSGIYLYTLTVGNKTFNGKIIKE